MKDANKILEEVETTQEQVQPYIRESANFFHKHEGKLFERSEAVSRLADYLTVEGKIAGKIIEQLVTDTVDPIIQIERGSVKHIGVIEFKEFKGAYGYIEFDDLYGQAKRVVCQQCVNESTLDSEVTHATAGDPHGSYSESATYDELVDGIHQHYEDVHDVMPSSVETGASLASGTTIGGNTAWHDGTSSISLQSVSAGSAIINGSIDASGPAPAEYDGRLLLPGDGEVGSSGTLTLGDDSVTLIEDFQELGRVFLLAVRNFDDHEGALFAATGSNTSILESDGSFAASDTDGNICVFVSSSDLFLKNRLGSDRQVRITALGQR